ncbi:hypothetical protein DDB_G0282465 [Dictyostelium discoideum AX4]|uniref:Uncharacterized protein n=1 Tax=Dictyostelium discoideum TaxID=44689 RepID=Q54SH5_DICDI|nr:hypothetical protein DDB_G0282465 [Dictyostelium discoideum AX4]EAL66092.1 hypothetical protein DDB_G0282465 [Dictyostelium discoideum AX4]|eukprot:XP_640064.1 hypothetical protein DDB_G0282465 [Dictyostelium discoideum AX4]
MVQLNKDKLTIQIISFRNVIIFSVILFIAINIIPKVINLIINIFYFTFNIIYYSLYILLCISVIFVWLYILCVLEELFYCFRDTFKTISNYLTTFIKNSVSNNIINYDTDLGYKGPFKKNNIININFLKINKTIEREIIVID